MRLCMNNNKKEDNKVYHMSQTMLSYLKILSSQYTLLILENRWLFTLIETNSLPRIYKFINL